jgi:hypothetical protein
LQLVNSRPDTALYDRAEPNPAAGRVDIVIARQSNDGRRLFVALNDGLLAMRPSGCCCAGSMCRT